MLPAETLFVYRWPGSPAGMRRLRRIVVLSTGLFVASCAPPWKQAYVRGEQAIAAARYDDAAVAFSESCDLEPDVSDACVRARTLRRRAVESAVSAASERCGSDLGACLQSLKTARALAVHERELGAQVEALLDDASARHAERCALTDGPRTFESMMVAARCLAQHEDAVGTAAHRRRVAEGLGRLADGLDPGDDDDLPQRSVRAALAHCYAPTSTRADAVRAALGAIVARHRARLQIGTLDGLPTPVGEALCEAGAVRRGPLRCDAGGGPVVVVEAALGAGRVGHETHETPKAVRYVAHVDERPNPDYAQVRQRVADLQDQTRAAAAAKDAADIACRAAEDTLRQAGYCTSCDARTQEERECDQKDAAERALREVRDHLDDEERRLRNTDPVLRIPRYADFSFIETRHVWEQPVQLQARCNERNGPFALPPWSTTRTVRFTDDTHVGFARAKLAEDPLVEPTGAQFAEETLGLARGELQAFVDRCVEAFAQDATRCDGTLDCAQRRALYRGEDPVASLVGSFSAAVDQSRPDLPRFPCRGAR